MKVFNLATNEEIKIQNVSPKFAVQWCESVRQGRSLEFAAMSEAERDKEFPVTEGSISISCGDYCTQIDDWQFAKKQWQSLDKAAFQAKNTYEAILVAEIKRKYPGAELIYDYDDYENRDRTSIEFNDEEFSLRKMDADEEWALENNFPEFYEFLQLKAN